MSNIIETNTADGLPSKTSHVKGATNRFYPQATEPQQTSWITAFPGTWRDLFLKKKRPDSLGNAPGSITEDSRSTSVLDVVLTPIIWLQHLFRFCVQGRRPHVLLIVGVVLFLR